MSIRPPGEDSEVLERPKYVFDSPAGDGQATICVHVNVKSKRLRNPCGYLINNIKSKFGRHIQFTDCVNQTILVITSQDFEKEIADFVEKQMRDLISPPKSYVIEGCGFLNVDQLEKSSD